MRKFYVLLFVLACMSGANAQWTYTSLSEAKAYMGATVLGSKAYFAGGYNNSSMLTTVEIYDFTTGEWDITNNLSVARELPTAVACGSKVLFAGGADFYGSGAVYATVDIFDTVAQSWSVEELSVPRLGAAAVSHGNKVLFAGGANPQQGLVYDIVDIYDIETGEWTTASLSEPRVVWWATVSDLAIFAGGYNLQTVSNRVDIYNFTTGTWSIDSLSIGRAFLTLTTIGSKVMIAGGMTAANVRSNVVDIYNAATGTWDIAYLSFPRAFCDNQNAVTVCGKAFFVGGGNINLNGYYWTDSYNIIDIYDEASDTWSVDYLAHSPIHHAVVGYENKFLVAGGIISTGYQSIVEIYTCPSSSCLPEGITFTTQEEIDNFQTNYPGCTEIEGDVTINGEDITNLSGLSVLTSIGMNFLIGVDGFPGGSANPNLTSLTGLDNLSFIGGHLHVGRNIALTTLTGLESLTSISGDLEIAENDVLSGLDGLENLSSIGENGLNIIGNDALTNLNGLENLTSIGYIQLSQNSSLNSLSGLENLTTIGGVFSIVENDALTSLTGLNNLTSIGNWLWIHGNNILTNLIGLENLVAAGGVFLDNTSLTSLSGMESLASIGEYGLGIQYNNALTSLSGMESLTSIGIGIWIMENNSLSTCEAEWLCSYLSNPTGIINIYGNAEGCSNPPEVAAACGISPFCLPYGDYYFTSQADIDNFQTDYPDCTELEGNVNISGNDITNLNGLSVVTSIENMLRIEDNMNLTSLTGLDNLTYIGYPLFIYNNALTSLTGLDNLTYIGGLSIYSTALTSLIGLDNLTTIAGDLFIGSNIFGGNPALTSLTGLNNVTSIGGDINIGWNSSLTGLTGLDNVDAGSISNLTILNNPLLSECDVESICDYLASPNGTVVICINAPGCNSPEEVEAACLTTVNETNATTGITIIPNPSNERITIYMSVISGNTLISIFTVSGEKVMERQIQNTETQLDVSVLPRGVCFVRVQDEKGVKVAKFIKE